MILKKFIEMVDLMSKILFIVEGEVTEHQIIDNLNRVILKEIRENFTGK